MEVDTGTLATRSGVAQSAGTLDLASGTTLVSNPGNAVTLDGGVLRGTGTVEAALVNAGGAVEPGASPGLLTVTGNYTQAAGATLRVEIAGTTPASQFDRLAVSGAAALDGTLAIVRSASFTPAVTDTFKVVTAGSRTGQFDALTGAQVGEREFSASYEPDGVTLELQENVPDNTGAPSIPPAPTVGDTITCNPGTWTGSPAFAFAWRRDGQPIAGATGAEYAVVSADVGHDLVCRVTATNGAGSAAADSNVARAVAPEPEPTPTPTTAPAPTATPQPVATPKPTTPAAAAKPRAVPVQQIASLPSAKRCVSRRKFRIRLRAPRGEKLRRGEVFLNGKRIRAVRGRRLTAPVDLRGLPKGRFTVRIVVTVRSGKRFAGSRRYRTCAPKRRTARGSPSV